VACSEELAGGAGSWPCQWQQELLAATWPVAGIVGRRAILKLFDSAMESSTCVDKWPGKVFGFKGRQERNWLNTNDIVAGARGSELHEEVWRGILSGFVVGFFPGESPPQQMAHKPQRDERENFIAEPDTRTNGQLFLLVSR